MRANPELERLFYAELTDQLRHDLMERTQQMLGSQDLAQFRVCQPGTQATMIPLSLYDIARRLPVISNDPMYMVGEYFSMLLTLRKNYISIFASQSQNTLSTVNKLEDAIIQLVQDVSLKVVNKSLNLAVEDLDKITKVLERAFPVMPRAQISTNTQTPTQQDIKNLEELFFQIPSHHGRAQVLAAYLKELGVDETMLLSWGTQVDVDFTQLPPQQFWILYECCQKYAPGVKR